MGGVGVGGGGGRGVETPEGWRKGNLSLGGLTPAQSTVEGHVRRERRLARCVM